MIGYAILALLVIWLLLIFGEPLWIRYQIWFINNFVVGEKKCPKCGNRELMYDSDLCYRCYYTILGEIGKEKKKNG